MVVGPSRVPRLAAWSLTAGFECCKLFCIANLTAAALACSRFLIPYAGAPRLAQRATATPRPTETTR